MEPAPGLVLGELLGLGVLGGAGWGDFFARVSDCRLVRGTMMRASEWVQVMLMARLTTMGFGGDSSLGWDMSKTREITAQRLTYKLLLVSLV